MNKKWEIFKIDKEKVAEMQKKYNINNLLAILLSNREITSEEQINKFLNPKRNDFIIHLECQTWKKQ